VALACDLLSSDTVFPAVDSSQQTGGERGTTVLPPVLMADGVQGDTSGPDQRAAR